MSIRATYAAANKPKSDSLAKPNSPFFMVNPIACVLGIGGTGFCTSAKTSNTKNHQNAAFLI